jgi:hypothetical protein
MWLLDWSHGSLYLHQDRIEALVEIIFLSPPTLPGTLPSTEKVPSLCFGHSLFGAISLANSFWIDAHPTQIGLIEQWLIEVSGSSPKLIGEGTAWARRCILGAGPLHTHLSYIHLHKIVAKLDKEFQLHTAAPWTFDLILPTLKIRGKFTAILGVQTNKFYGCTNYRIV